MAGTVDGAPLEPRSIAPAGELRRRHREARRGARLQPADVDLGAPRRAVRIGLHPVAGQGRPRGRRRSRSRRCRGGRRVRLQPRWPPTGWRAGHPRRPAGDRRRDQRRGDRRDRRWHSARQRRREGPGVGRRRRGGRAARRVGLTVAGASGVHRVLDLLRQELVTTMSLCGLESVSAISRALVEPSPDAGRHQPCSTS